MIVQACDRSAIPTMGRPQTAQGRRLEIELTKKRDRPAGGDLVGEIVQVLDRDENDDALWMRLGESASRFEAVHLGHVDVHQNQIRELVSGAAERVRARCGVRDQLKPGRRIYHGSGYPAKSGLVVDDHDSDAGGRIHFHGDLNARRRVESRTAGRN